MYSIYSALINDNISPCMIRNRAIFPELEYIWGVLESTMNVVHPIENKG